MHTSINQLSNISAEIVRTYGIHRDINRIEGENLPFGEHVIATLQDLLTLLFPGYIGRDVPDEYDISFFVNGLVNSAYLSFREEISRSLSYQCKLEKKFRIKNCNEKGEEYSLSLLKKIPELREILHMDVQAAYDGDPAARSLGEIILSYPGILAVATYRLGHELYLMDVPFIPRIMTEWAHSKTGIDIHPGATIGRRFFIDHGTGVVIGETTEIGNDVKLYHGVTLGARSFPKNPDGSVVKGGKRHPTIEDGVTIYPNATILGGDTVIGRGAVIGGNVWLTSPVQPGTQVTTRVSQEFKESGSEDPSFDSALVAMADASST